MPRDQNHALAARIRKEGYPATVPCFRCVDRKVPCLSAPFSSRCADCAFLGRSCGMSTSDREWDKLQAEKRRTRRQLLEAERQKLRGDAARKAAEAKEQLEVLRLQEELDEIGDKERDLFRQDAEEARKEHPSEDTPPSSGPSGSSEKSTDILAEPVVPSLSEPFAADPGWLQTDELLPSSSFDLDAFVQDFPFQPSGDRLSPIPCSS